MGRSVAIDLGTANVLVYVQGVGIVLREPSVVAVNRKERRVVAVGHEANYMIGRTSGDIVAVRPLKDGVIADFQMTEAMMRYFIRKALKNRSIFRSATRGIVCVPCGVTDVEQRSVESTARRAGIREVFIAEEPFAAALGAGMPVMEPCGSMVVDIGGGTTEMAVVSLGDIVTSQSYRTAGDKMNDDIISYIRKRHDLLIGERTAEDIKTSMGCAVPSRVDKVMEVRGRNMKSGLPMTVDVTTDDVFHALQDCTSVIVEGVKEVLGETPPELASDIMARGITLTGGGALLEGLDALIARETGIPVYLAQYPLDCVALGAGAMLESRIHNFR